MSIEIHGKQYVTVDERVKAAHEACKTLSISTEVLPIAEKIVVKATVVTDADRSPSEWVETIKRANAAGARIVAVEGPNEPDLFWKSCGNRDLRTAAGCCNQFRVLHPLPGGGFRIGGSK